MAEFIARQQSLRGYPWPIDDVIRRYVLLGLRLARHIDGIVDAYYGPHELSQQVESEPRTAPKELALEAARLREEADGIEDRRRSRYLAAQLDGLAAVAERLAGEPLSYKEEVRRCYGIDVEWVDDDRLADGLDTLDRLIPGSEPLRERYQGWQRALELPSDALLQALDPVKDELRRRTQSQFGLPAGESADVELVANQPWLGFNYYLGGLKSRIAVNTDVPTIAEFVPTLVAHEIYPGHHTEHSWKEQLLVRDGDHLEESIFLIGTPQCLVSEGIASHALDALGPEAEPACESVLAGLGHGYDVELAQGVRRARRVLAAVDDNAGIMLHEQHIDPDTVRTYYRRWTVASDERIDKRMEFLLHPVWRAYSSIYEAGERLVETWTAGKADRFRRLLTEQMVPSDLTQG
ncbi:MAG TPA: DUF885 domain-containing protein [Candidatus Dormibacteraeota bacterium]|nr:DUF885 domain-containing protein [Candidatus Dormibacteraeota bacterium]